MDLVLLNFASARNAGGGFVGGAKAFFKVDSRGPFLERPFVAGVITAPAPNAGAEIRRDPDAGQRIAAALRLRAGYVLAVAEEQRHRTLLLGAWGCGVFRNDPVAVADAFAGWFGHPRFAGAFDRVVFAILDTRPGAPTRSAFAARFSAA